MVRLEISLNAPLSYIWHTPFRASAAMCRNQRNHTEASAVAPSLCVISPNNNQQAPGTTRRPAGGAHLFPSRLLPHYLKQRTGWTSGPLFILFVQRLNKRHVLDMLIDVSTCDVFNLYA